MHFQTNIQNGPPSGGWSFWDVTLGPVFSFFGFIFPSLLAAYLVVGIATSALYLLTLVEHVKIYGWYFPSGRSELPASLFLALFFWPIIWRDYLREYFKSNEGRLWTEDSIRRSDERWERIYNNPSNCKEQSIHDDWVRRRRPERKREGTLEERTARQNDYVLKNIAMEKRMGWIFVEPLLVFCGLMVAVFAWQALIAA